MSYVGIVAIFLGVFVLFSRGPLLLFPAATLRWFEQRIRTEKRTRLLGVSLLPLPVLMLWAGASEDTGLATILFIFGILFMLVAILWLVIFPRNYMDFCGAFVPPDPSSILMEWRMMGLFGVGIGAALIYFGWLAL